MDKCIQCGEDTEHGIFCEEGWARIAPVRVNREEVTGVFIELSKDQIDRVFHCADLGLLREDEEPHQIHVLVELYKIAYPDWDRIASVDGWPTVTKKTNEYLFRKFMDFDDKHHNKKGREGVMRGGLWMNNGFSTTQIHPDLQDWQIDPSTGIVYYNEEGENATT